MFSIVNPFYRKVIELTTFSSEAAGNRRSNISKFFQNPAGTYVDCQSLSLEVKLRLTKEDELIRLEGNEEIRTHARRSYVIKSNLIEREAERDEDVYMESYI